MEYLAIATAYDHYPHGYPRNEKKLNKIFQKYNFELKYHNYFTQTDTARVKAWGTHYIITLKELAN